MKITRLENVNLSVACLNLSRLSRKIVKQLTEVSLGQNKLLKIVRTRDFRHRRF